MLITDNLVDAEALSFITSYCELKLKGRSLIQYDYHLI